MVSVCRGIARDGKIAAALRRCHSRNRRHVSQGVTASDVAATREFKLARSPHLTPGVHGVFRRTNRRDFVIPTDGEAGAEESLAASLPRGGAMAFWYDRYLVADAIEKMILEGFDSILSHTVPNREVSQAVASAIASAPRLSEKAALRGEAQVV
jgi:hypothetical protein